MTLALPTKPFARSLENVLRQRLAGYPAVEIKSGSTVAADIFGGFDYWRKHLAGVALNSCLIYGGEIAQSRQNATVLPWTDLGSLRRTLATG